MVLCLYITIIHRCSKHCWSQHTSCPFSFSSWYNPDLWYYISPWTYFTCVPILSCNLDQWLKLCGQEKQDWDNAVRCRWQRRETKRDSFLWKITKMLSYPMHRCSEDAPECAAWFTPNPTFSVSKCSILAAELWWAFISLKTGVQKMFSLIHRHLKTLRLFDKVPPTRILQIYHQKQK